MSSSRKLPVEEKMIKMNIFYSHRHLTQMLQVQVRKTMKIKYSEIKTLLLKQKSTVVKHANINFGVNIIVVFIKLCTTKFYQNKKITRVIIWQTHS